MLFFSFTTNKNMTQLRFDISYRIWIEIIWQLSIKYYLYFLTSYTQYHLSLQLIYLLLNFQVSYIFWKGGGSQGKGVDNDTTEVIQDPANTYKDPWCWVPGEPGRRSDPRPRGSWGYTPGPSPASPAAGGRPDSRGRRPDSPCSHQCPRGSWPVPGSPASWSASG